MNKRIGIILIAMMAMSIMQAKAQDSLHSGMGTIYPPPAPPVAAETLDVDTRAVSGFNVTEFISRNFQFPDIAFDDTNFVALRVFTEFVIEKDCSISNIKIQRFVEMGNNPIAASTKRAVTAEVYRVMKKMPRWQTPGMLDGEPVRTHFVVPFYIKSE